MRKVRQRTIVYDQYYGTITWSYPVTGGQAAGSRALGEVCRLLYGVLGRVRGVFGRSQPAILRLRGISAVFTDAAQPIHHGFDS